MAKKSITTNVNKNTTEKKVIDTVSAKKVEPKVDSKAITKEIKKEDIKVEAKKADVEDKPVKVEAKPVKVEAKKEATKAKVEKKETKSKKSSKKTTSKTSVSKAAAKTEKVSKPKKTANAKVETVAKEQIKLDIEANNQENEINYLELLGESPIKVVVSQGIKTGKEYPITVALKNYGFLKTVKVKYTEDNWKTFLEKELIFKSQDDNDIEEWSTIIELTTKDKKSFQYVVSYQVNDEIYWDNNSGNNYLF